jgi:hypothetical protein
MLLDAVPRELKATWLEAGTKQSTPYTTPENAQIEVRNLYKSVVLRFTPGISTGTIPSLQQSVLTYYYEKMSSIMTCLWNSSRPESQATTAAPGSCTHLPLSHLFCFVISDTLGLLHLLDSVQSDIVQSTASPDAQIDDMLVKRTSIGKLYAHLPTWSHELKKALEELVERGNGGNPQHIRIQELGEHFERTVGNLKEASNAISGTLQFIESHRAILEAESVARLTELAFLFIPLSFAASLFSMQIQELTNPVPVWSFVAFAISLSILTYALRLVARSTWVQWQKQALSNSIREHNAIRPGAPIRNKAIFAWIFARIKGPVLLVVFLFASFLVPLFSVIWTHQVDVGLKIGLSFLFLVFMSSIVGVVILAVPEFCRKLRRRRTHTIWSYASPEVAVAEAPKELTRQGHLPR